MRLRRALVLILAAATPATAQSVGTGNGFLLGSPALGLTISGGWALALAGSDLFSFTTEQLTINRREFSSPSLGADAIWNVTPRTALVVSAALSGMKKRTEFRDFIDNNAQPIEQNTRFRRVPVTFGVRRYLTPPGRAIGKLAWVPAHTATYVGAGVGAMWYQFKQDGDFIDFETNAVEPLIFDSNGWTPTANAVAGMDYTIKANLAITGELRYNWARAGLSPDFTDFHKLDLSGFTTTVGLSVRF
jgi:hypothetical protein